MELSTETKRKLDTLARIYQTEVRSQAPGDNISRGTTIVVVYEDNSFSFASVLSEKVRYGRYLDEGTGPYYKSNAPRGPWNPDPGKGTKGIIPRYWLSISEVLEERLYDMALGYIAEQREKELEEQYEPTVKTVTIEV